MHALLHIQVACACPFLPVTAEAGDRVIQGGRKDGEGQGEEDGEGQEAKLDQAHLAQVQPHVEAKVERGRNRVFGELWLEPSLQTLFVARILQL